MHKTLKIIQEDRIFESIRSTVGRGLDSDAVINDNSTCGLPADDEPCNM